MGYIDENLMNGEQVVHRSKLHWIVFLGPLIFTIISFMFLAGGKGSTIWRSLLLNRANLGCFGVYFLQDFGIWNNQ